MIKNYISPVEALKIENRIAWFYYIVTWFLLYAIHSIYYFYSFYFTRYYFISSDPDERVVTLEGFDFFLALKRSFLDSKLDIALISFINIGILFLLVVFFHYLLIGMMKKNWRILSFDGLISHVMKVLIILLICTAYTIIPPLYFPTPFLYNLPDYSWFAVATTKTTVITLTFFLINTFFVVFIGYVPSFLAYKISRSDQEDKQKIKRKIRMVYWYYFLRSRLVDAPYSFGIGSLLLLLSSVIVLSHKHQDFPISILFFVISAFVLLLSDTLNAFTKIFKTFEEFTVFNIKEKLILTEKFPTIVVGYGNLGKQIAFNELKREMLFPKEMQSFIKNTWQTLSTFFLPKDYYLMIVDNDFELRLIPRHILFIETAHEKYDELYKDKINRISIGLLRGEELNLLESDSEKKSGFDSVSLVSICGDAENLGLWKLLKYSQNPVIMVTAFNTNIAYRINSYFQNKLIINNPQPIILALTNSLEKRMFFHLNANSYIHVVDDTEYETAEAALYAIRKSLEEKIQEIVIYSPTDWAVSFRNKILTYKPLYQGLTIKLAYLYENLDTKEVTIKSETNEKYCLLDVWDSFEINYLFKHQAELCNGNKFSRLQEVLIKDDKKRLLVVAIRPFSKVISKLQALVINNKYKYFENNYFILCAYDAYKSEIDLLASKLLPENLRQNQLISLESNNITANIFNAISHNSPHNAFNAEKATEAYYLNLLIANRPLSLYKLICNLQGIRFNFKHTKEKLIPSFYQTYSFAADIYCNIPNTFMFKGEFSVIKSQPEFANIDIDYAEHFIKALYPGTGKDDNIKNFFFSENLLKDKSTDSTHGAKSNYALSLFHEPHPEKIVESGLDIENHCTIKILAQGNDNPTAFSQVLSKLYQVSLIDSDILNMSDKTGYNIIYEFGSICNDQGHFIQELFLEPFKKSNRTINKSCILAAEIILYKYESNELGKLYCHQLNQLIEFEETTKGFIHYGQQAENLDKGKIVEMFNKL